MLTGRCDPTTGALTGSWVMKGDPKNLQFKPLPKGSMPIVERRMERGTPSELSCSLSVDSPAVFGFGNSEKASRINAALKVRFYDHTDSDLAQMIDQCLAHKSIGAVMGWYSVEMNSQGVLSVLTNGIINIAPSVHSTWNAAARAVSIDAVTGKTLVLSDVVTSPRALRPLIKRCAVAMVETIGINDFELERSIQGVEADKNGDPVEPGAPFAPSSVHVPGFLVLPEGLAVLISGMGTVGAFLEQTGPILPWTALAKEGVLRKDSPVARIWQKQLKSMPAGDEPPCTQVFKPQWLR